jgi:hypothetical protein
VALPVSLVLATLLGVALTSAVAEAHHRCWHKPVCAASDPKPIVSEPVPVASDPVPVASYAYSPSAPVTGQEVAFDGTGSSCSATPCSYTWEDDGADGPAGTQWPLGSGQTLKFTFSNAGDKYVRLTVLDAEGRSDSTVKTVTVGTVTVSDGGIVTWAGDFETGGLSQWQWVLAESADRLRTVTSPVRQGSYAARFEVHDSDHPGSANPRAQLNSAPMHREGDERYIGWSTYFPSDFPSIPSGAWFVFFQFHGEPYNGSPRLGFGVSPDGRIELRRDAVYNYDRVWSQPQQRGRWTDFTVRVKWSKDPSVGFVELWVDGARQTFSNGQTRLAMATIQSDQTGVENIATNYRKRGAIPGEVTLLHDAVKVGTSYATVQP